MNNAPSTEDFAGDRPGLPLVLAKASWLSSFGSSEVNHVAALVIAAASLSALIGHVTGVTILTEWVPGSRPMVVESALGSLMASVGFSLVQRTKGIPVSLIAGLVQLLGWANLILRTSLVTTHRFSFLEASGVRPAPGSALVFIMAGLGLTLLSRPRISTKALWAVALLGVGVSSVGLVTLLAYASGLVAAVWWGAFSLQMALPMAVGAFAMGSALLASSFQRSRDSSRHLSIASAVLAILGLLLLFAGADAAVLANSDAISTTRTASRKNADEIRSIQALVDFTRQSETSQRAYLLTGGQQYLTTFEVGRQGVAQILRDGNIHDAMLLATTKLKLDELDRTMALAKRGQREEAIRVVKSSDGFRHMEEIEQRAKALTNRLQGANLLYRSETQQSMSSLRRTILFSYVLAILLAAGALLLVGTEMKRRSRLEMQLRETEVRMISELREQTVRAEEANRAKSSFLASMSHEIRTPMNAILGMADMLWETELSESQRHYVEVFRRAGGSLLVLINDILDLSKIESGNFCLEKIDFDLQEVVDQVIEIFQSKADSKMLALFAHVEAGTRTHVLGDPARLQQILVNLLSNAIKFTKEGEVGLRVRSRNTATHISLEFEVSDTGIGIASDKLACIFEDFTQAESSTTRRFGGTGLGLGISRRLARHMDGELRVHSEVGQGSTFLFNVVLPIGIEQKSATAANLDEIAGKRVLIVDNNPTNRVILSEMCAGWGMFVTSCRSGAEAIESTKTSLEQQPFSLALVDRRMPDMDGFETVRQVRILDPRIAVLIVSSDSQAGDVARCRELGLCGHLMKPIRRKELLQQVGRALGNISELMPTVRVPDTTERPLSTEKRTRLLVAEDSEDNRFLLQAYCQGTAFDLTFAENGELALAAYQASSFDLVLMDVQMPVMDGLTAATRIRAIETAGGLKRIPILALTANALPEDVARATEAGCDSHLAKPISKRDFLGALEQWQTTVHPPESGPKIKIPEGLGELAQGYLASRRREIPVFERLLERCEFEEMRLIAHNLKGSGTSYGFPEITSLGGLMEQSCKDRNLAALSVQLAELSTYTRTASQQLAPVQVLSMDS